MHVSRIELADYRNYRRAELRLQPGSTLFVGKNGQGKTNLVEAIVVLATGGSHRVPGEAALVRAGADSAIIRSELTHGSRTISVDVQLQRKGANKAQAQGKRIPMRNLPRYAQVVLFAPEDLAIVRGEPGGRRKFLDDLVVHRQPRLAGTIADYEKVLRQRNSLLKSARQTRMRPEDLTTLDVWDDRMVGLGLELEAARQRIVQDLAPHVDHAYQAIAGAEHATRLELETNVPPSADDYRTMLEQRRQDELDRAVSLVGPHRDDLHLQLNDLLARHYASHGESWSYALSLKLASAQLLRGDSAGDPVLILDDVFAELDTTRRDRLASAIEDFEQVLITAAVEDDVPSELANRKIRISDGEIEDADDS
ncbi:MAG TPA: DNA replication/repair protein RecF [Candidatus Agrococcus pullicola]|uniref:DNA replication and repair protein RecF n=1 Tax=Candidatus Agrococcus pullicola TaxID=2838429 RepID=A0A9D1YSB0_9MICO|nr:DNA replication/repair protein RecF [Candidatus Agrococcus pullicola]